MGAIIAALTAIAALLNPLEKLISAVWALWHDEVQKAAVGDPTRLMNDAVGAAQAAVDLETDAHKQIALCESALAVQQPNLTIEHRTGLAAVAVAHVKRIGRVVKT